MGCRGPKAETLWSEPILLRTGSCGTATPLRVPCTSPAGVVASALSLCHHPKSCWEKPSRPTSTPHPSSLLLPALSPSTIDPAPPALTQEKLEGVTTASTFVLDQPRCVFNNYSNAVIWLVVTLDKGRWEQPRTAFQRFPDPVHAYMTLNATLDSYPCPKPAGDITVLRVGSETSCAQDETRPTCNGPLPGPGPYRVKFLALEGSVPVAETDWSAPITPQGENGVVLGVWGGPRGLNAEQQWFGVRAPVSTLPLLGLPLGCHGAGLSPPRRDPRRDPRARSRTRYIPKGAGAAPVLCPQPRSDPIPGSIPPG
uniref:Uroplakin 3B n=1 Tax=Serinus canaria TaxID=9135 RepID=A0A8C9MTE2_SERCA